MKSQLRRLFLIVNDKSILLCFIIFLNFLIQFKYLFTWTLSGRDLSQHSPLLHPQLGNGAAATCFPRPDLLLPRPSPPRRPLQDSQARRCASFLQLPFLFLLLNLIRCGSRVLPSLVWDALALRFVWIWISVCLIALLVRQS